MLNIVLPMAGRGSRFTNAGYALPKPLIPIHGIPMIKVVVDNLTPACAHRFIFVCQQAHLDQYDLVPQLKSYAENVEIIGIKGITEGQVCTVLLAARYFDNNEPLMTANTDQFIDCDINAYLEAMRARGLDGMIMTMKAQGAKWSYVKTDADGMVVETAEKKAISTDATVGIYNFARGRDLVRAARQMIADDLRVNNEFYTCPCYNYLVREGQKISVFPIGEDRNGMYGLGVPDDLAFFIKHSVSQKVKR